MFEELVEVAFGPWGLAAVVLVALPGGRKLIRTATKAIIGVGLMAADQVKQITVEVKKEAVGVMVEVQSEKHQKKQAVTSSSKLF